MNQANDGSDGYELVNEPAEPAPLQEPVTANEAVGTPGPISPTSVFCVQCGYNLTGVAIGSTCPECGRTVAPSFHGQMLPTSGKAIASLVLGICSIPGCVLYGFPAIACGILAMIFARKTRSQVAVGKANPGSNGMATAGMICGTIGLCLGLLYIALFVGFIVFSNF